MPPTIANVRKRLAENRSVTEALEKPVWLGEMCQKNWSIQGDLGHYCGRSLVRRQMPAKVTLRTVVD